MLDESYLDVVLGQLQIVPKDQEDRDELQQLLLHRLCYPSTELAQLHMQANRLGTLDLQTTSQQINISQQNILQKSHNQTPKKCKCCGLHPQPQPLPLCTTLLDIKNVGVNSHLFFITVTHTTIALLFMFFVYCLYAIVSNVFSCNYDANNLKELYQSAKYLELVGEWIFNVSLLGNVSCADSWVSYQIQCWLGVATIVGCAFIFGGLKYRKLKILTQLTQTQTSPQPLTIQIQNLPTTLTKPQLQTLLQQYQNSFQNLAPEHKKPIKIAKINRAAPFYFSSSIFSSEEAKKANQEYQRYKDMVVGVVVGRIGRTEFGIGREDREAVYRGFEKAKMDRIQVFKKAILASIKEAKEQYQDRVATTPAFVTFESSYNNSFLMQMHTKQNILFNRKNCFHFPHPIPPKKFRAIILNPPRPQQIIWTNLGQHQSSILLKKLGIFLITILFLTGTGAALYYIQAYNFQYAVNNPGKRSTMYLSFVVSISIIVLTYLIAAVLIVLSMKERNVTFMDQQASLNNKVILCQVGHFIIVPLVFHLFFKVQYTGVVALSQTVFFLSLQSAFIFPLFKILDPIYLSNRLRRHLSTSPQKKLPLTQIQLNKNFEYMQFGLGFHFSYIIRAVLFTCFYAPLQPVIVVFAIAGMVVTYWVFKYCLFCRSSRPIAGNTMVNIALNKMTAFGPILFGVGSLIWPYYIKREFIGLVPSIIQIVLGVILYLIPIQTLIQKSLQKLQISPQPQSTPPTVLPPQQKYLPNFYEHEYDRLNYMTSHQANMEYQYYRNQQKLRQKFKEREREREREKEGTNMGYLNLVGSVTGHVGAYQMINQVPEGFYQVGGGSGSGGNNGGDGDSRRLAKYEEIVYANQTNDNARLIQQILQTIKTAFTPAKPTNNFLINLKLPQPQLQPQLEQNIQKTGSIQHLLSNDKKNSIQTSYQRMLPNQQQDAKKM